MDPRNPNKGLGPGEQIDATDPLSCVEDSVMDLAALEWKKRFEEAESERRELADALEAIRSGQVDTIVTHDKQRLLRLLDANLVEDKERRIHEMFVKAESERRELTDALEAIRNGPVDTIVTHDKQRLLCLLDANLLGEIQRLVEELSHSNQKFRQVFEQSNDGIVIFDAEGNIMDVNLKAQEMWGYAHAEFLALTIPGLHSLHAAEGKNGLVSKFSGWQDTHTHTTGFTFETEFRRKDESLFYAEVSTSEMTLDGHASVLGVVKDITQRRKAEQALHQIPPHGGAVVFHFLNPDRPK